MMSESMNYDEIATSGLVGCRDVKMLFSSVALQADSLNPVDNLQAV